MTYRKRDIAPTVEGALKEMPAVILTGLRQAGKSTLLQNDPFLRGRKYYTLDDFETLEQVKRSPESLMDGEGPMTIDEAQKAPELLTLVKREVDRKRKPGRFLLSGSANFHLLKNVTESLAGRAIYLTLSPMTRREIRGTLDRPPFLKSFFENPHLESNREVKPIQAFEILHGGMPTVSLKETSDPALWFKGYEQTYLERDIRSLSQVGDLILFRDFLQLASLRSGQILKQSELARDAKMNTAMTSRYLSLLETSFLIYRLPPYLRNRASRLIKAPKLFFTDSGIACHLAGIRSEKQLDEDALKGALVETYIASNLMGILSSQWPEAKLYYWHIQGRHEVDFVISEGRKTLAIEVKWSSRWTDRDLSNLRTYMESDSKCIGGILAHNGTRAVPLGDRIWAIPLALLLE
ncbi:MAG: ATP-binding protein [Candidatus Omnitrophota bacterium]|nr:ATP-binding protein [Candidatus Omnitrophota bacterium]